MALATAGVIQRCVRGKDLSEGGLAMGIGRCPFLLNPGGKKRVSPAPGFICLHTLAYAPQRTRYDRPADCRPAAMAIRFPVHNCLFHDTVQFVNCSHGTPTQRRLMSTRSCTAPLRRIGIPKASDTNPPTPQGHNYPNSMPGQSDCDRKVMRL